MNVAGIESIRAGEAVLCLIVRAGERPAATTFLTPPEWKQQVGFVVYPAGGEIARHVHRPIERRLVGTSEVILVQLGRSCSTSMTTSASSSRRASRGRET